MDGIRVLNAREVDPRQLDPLVDYMRAHFDVVCADLTGAQEAHSTQVLRASDGIFLVTGSDHASLEAVGEKMDSLRALNLAGRCGLLLERTPHGRNSVEVEELTGVPVCSLVETAPQISRLAHWLASNTVSEYALAV